MGACASSTGAVTPIDGDANDKSPSNSKNGLTKSVVVSAADTSEIADSLGEGLVGMDIGESIGENAGVGIAIAIGAAGMIHDAMQLGDNTTGAVILEAGAALLETFEHVPFIAPAAFLLCAVARASKEALVLKEDARCFAETTRRVEKAMLQARDMERQRETVEKIVDVLEESLDLVKRLASRGIIESVMKACKDAKKLGEFKEDLVEAVGMLQLECTLDLYAMQQIEFNQTKELESKIEELGGLEECACDKEKTAALSALMKKSDALLLSKMDNLADETRNSMNEMTCRLSTMHLKTQSSLDNHFEKMQLEAEKAAMRNAILEQQVSTLANTLVEVKDMLKKCPVPANEPERLMQVNGSGVVGMTTDAPAFKEIEKCALEVYNLMERKVCVAVNFISQDTSHFPVFYLPSPDGASEPENMAVTDNEFVISPRKANVCQHVIHRAETVEFVGMKNAPAQLTPAEFQIVSQVDPTVAAKMAENKKKNVVCSKENGCPFNSVWWELQVNATDSVWYRGQPIFCNGSAVGSFCTVSPEGKPQDFEYRYKPLVEANVARIGVAIEKQALMRREYHMSQLFNMVGPNASPMSAELAQKYATFGMAAMPPAGCESPSMKVRETGSSNEKEPFPHEAKKTSLMQKTVTNPMQVRENYFLPGVNDQSLPKNFLEAGDLVNFVF